MKNRNPICKGINKAKHIPGCGKETANREHGLCPSCRYEFFTTDEIGKIIYVKSFLPKVSKRTEQRKKESDKVTREKLKTLSQYEAEAKKSFQKFIRLRDKDLPCISCGSPNPVDWCGSHYFPAGMYSGLIFDERNCHGACNTYCNKYLSGNLPNYRIGLVNRYGESFVTQLEADSDTLRNYKYTRQELIEIKRKYDLKIKSYG